jgi:sortase A
MSARRVLFWSGLAALLAGGMMLAYVGWQLYGTDIVSKRHQEQLVDELRAEWAKEAGEPGLDPRSGPGEATALIRIPRFGSTYVMPVLEGTTDDVLAQGFGHFLGTAAPGEVGNFAVAAHRITHGAPLRRMPDLQVGDEVVVETRTASYHYVLDTDPDDLVVPFTAGWVLAALPVNPDGGVDVDPAAGRRLITLTTCAELFHTDDRIVAFGHLESVSDKMPEVGGAPR